MVKKVEKVGMGQNLRTEMAPDRSSYMKGDLAMKKCGGGPRDVSHSLSGAGGAVDYLNKGKGDKGKGDY